MIKNKVKPIWYDNPKYYLAAIIIIVAFRILFDTLHTLLPEIIKINGSVLDLPFVIVLMLSLAFFIRKRWKN